MKPRGTAQAMTYDVRNTAEALTIVAGPDFTRADFAMALLNAGYDPTKPLDDHFSDWTVAVDDQEREVWTLYK